MKTIKPFEIILIGCSAIIGSILIGPKLWHSCSNFDFHRDIIFWGEEFGDGYCLSTVGGKKTFINHPDYGIVVPSTVLEYAFNSTFIIASQRPWNDSIIPRMYGLNYDDLHRAFKKSEYKQYWIINKKQKGEYLGCFPYLEYKMGNGMHDIEFGRAVYSNVHGPFLLEEYLRKRDELGVPDSLVLKKYWKWVK